MKAGMQTLADSGAHAATQLAALAPVIEWTWAASRLTGCR